MSNWRPASDAAAARRRSAMLMRIRQRFVQHDVLEVEVPALSPAAGTDPQIEHLLVHSSLEPARRLYLGTSPEFFMKRLLAAGYPDIYTICRSFRDGEAGRRHQPEFTLLEWYRLNFGLEQIIRDCCELIATALDKPELSATVTHCEYTDAFQQYADIDALHASIDELARCAGADSHLRQSLGGDRDAWLDLILSHRVAPGFAKDRLTVLAHYPASQAALARLCPQNAQLADRFEVFYGDVELANGFVELRDADEQLRRFDNEQLQRQKSQQSINPIDMALIDALRHGLPACAGVALGVERLQMLADTRNDIADVLTFVFGQEHEH